MERNMDPIMISNILIALIASWIAIRQYKMSKYKVMHDLYEKRFKVFGLCHELLNKITAGQEVGDDLFGRFVQAKNESHFLFNKKLSGMIEEFYASSTIKKQYFSKRL
jgi:hypothetical protein